MIDPLLKAANFVHLGLGSNRSIEIWIRMTFTCLYVIFVFDSFHILHLTYKLKYVSDVTYQI